LTKIGEINSTGRKRNPKFFYIYFLSKKSKINYDKD